MEKFVKFEKMTRKSVKVKKMKQKSLKIKNQMEKQMVFDIMSRKNLKFEKIAIVIKINLQNCKSYFVKSHETYKNLHFKDFKKNLPKAKKVIF